MTLDAATKAKAKAELNEPDDNEPCLASLTSRFANAVGAVEASKYEWALLATLRQAKWDVDKALDKMKALSKFANAHSDLFEGLTAEE